MQSILFRAAAFQHSGRGALQESTGSTPSILSSKGLDELADPVSYQRPVRFPTVRRFEPLPDAVK